MAGHALAEKGGCHVPCLHHASRVSVIVCHVAAEASSGVIRVLEKVQCCSCGSASLPLTEGHNRAGQRESRPLQLCVA